MPLSKQELDALRKRYKIGAPKGRVPGFIETGIRQSAPAELLGYGLTAEEEDALRASEPSFSSRIGSGAISGGLDFLPALGLGLTGVGGPLALAGVFGAGGGVKSYRSRQRQAQREGRGLNASDYAGALKDAAFEGLIGATLPIAGRVGSSLVKSSAGKFAASLASEVAYINAAKSYIMGEPIDVENVAEDLVLLGLFKTTGEALGQARKIKSKVENEKPNSAEIAEREGRVAEAQGALQIPYYPPESKLQLPYYPSEPRGTATTPPTAEQLASARKKSGRQKYDKAFAEEDARRRAIGAEPLTKSFDQYGRLAERAGLSPLEDIFKPAELPKKTGLRDTKKKDLGRLGEVASKLADEARVLVPEPAKPKAKETLGLPYYPKPEEVKQEPRVRGRKPSEPSKKPITPEPTAEQAREAELRSKAQKEKKAVTPITPEQQEAADIIARREAKGKRFAAARKKESARRKALGIPEETYKTSNVPEKSKKRPEFYNAEDYGRIAKEIGSAELRDLFGTKKPKRLAIQPKKVVHGRAREFLKIASETGGLVRGEQKSQQREAISKATQQEFGDAVLKKQKAIPYSEKKGLPAPEARKGLPSPQEIYAREGVVRGQAPTERPRLEFTPRPSEAQKREITKTSFKQEPGVKAQKKAIRAVKKQIRNRAREIVDDVAKDKKRRPTKTDIKAAETLAYGLIARDPTIPKELRQRAAKAARELEQSLSKDKGYERDLFGARAPEKPTAESIKSLKDSSPRKVTERTLGLTKKFAKQVVDSIVKRPKAQESLRENKKAIKEAATTIEKEAFRCL